MLPGSILKHIISGRDTHYQSKNVQHLRVLLGKKNFFSPLLGYMSWSMWTKLTKDRLWGEKAEWFC